MGRVWQLAFNSLCLAAIVGALGCNQSDFGKGPYDPDPGDQPEGPGDPVWGNADVSCETESDCAPNEDCIDNICQMARCNDGPYDSAAPIGAKFVFFSDREIITVDDDTYQSAYWVDGYLPQGSSISYPQSGGSWNVSSNKITDVAGGDFFGQRPEMFVAAVQGSSSVVIKKQTGTQDLNVGFQAIGVAACDVDQDQLDEIVALSSSGKVALCNADEDSCQGFQFQNNVTGVDVACADIDGDHYGEPVFLLDVGDHSEIIAWNVDHELNEQEETVGFSVNTKYMKMDAGDADGDGIAEVFALVDGGWIDWDLNPDDHLHIWRVAADPSQLGDVAVGEDTKDVAVADLDMDEADEVMVLRGTRTVGVYKGSGGGQLSSAYTGDLSVTQNPQRLAAADFDGNSPSATMMSGPELVSGQVVPTMVLHFPPHSATYSDGIPYVFVGDTELHTETYSDTVGLRTSAELGGSAQFELLGIGVQTSLTERITTEMRANHSISYEQDIGNRFVILPDIDKHGNDYSVVWLTSACYHVYHYRLDDPDQMMGGDGADFVLAVPVGGNTTVWSSKRYNAMAKAVGGLPQVGPTFELGNPASYPDHIAKPDGSPLYDEDLVFRDYPKYQASDVARIGWWLSRTETETNEALVYTELSTNFSLRVPGVTFHAERGSGEGHGFGLAMGNQAIFGGAVPPIPDNPDTPEDEYADHAYSFEPIVYRQKYTDSEGNEAGYYVLSYATGQ